MDDIALSLRAILFLFVIHAPCGNVENGFLAENLRRIDSAAYLSRLVFHVFLADFHTIDAQLFRCHIHQKFKQNQALRRAVSSGSSRRRGVGICPDAVAVKGRHPIGSRKVCKVDDSYVSGTVVISAVVKYNFLAAACDDSFLGKADFSLFVKHLTARNVLCKFFLCKFNPYRLQGL